MNKNIIFVMLLVTTLLVLWITLGVTKEEKIISLTGVVNVKFVPEIFVTALIFGLICSYLIGKVTIYRIISAVIVSVALSLTTIVVIALTISCITPVKLATVTLTEALSNALAGSLIGVLIGSLSKMAPLFCIYIDNKKGSAVLVSLFMNKYFILFLIVLIFLIFTGVLGLGSIVVFTVLTFLITIVSKKLGLSERMTTMILIMIFLLFVVKAVVTGTLQMIPIP